MSTYKLAGRSIVRAPARSAHDLRRLPSVDFGDESEVRVLDEAAEIVASELSKGGAIDRIALASPAFAARLRSSLKGPRLDEKLARGAWRYLTRASSRPTPFGAFAGYGVVDTDGGTSELELGSFRDRFHVREDAGKRRSTSNGPQASGQMLQVAPLLYDSLGRIRLYEPLDKELSTSLILSQIGCDATLYEFLMTLPRQFARAEFIELSCNAGIVDDKQDAQAALDDLESHGLILASDTRGSRLSVEESSLTEVMGHSEGVGEQRPDLKVDLEFVGDGALPAQSKAVLQDNLDWIVPIFGVRPQSDALVSFAKRLYQRFSNEPVPLLLALDSDWVGYSEWGDESRRLLRLVPNIRRAGRPLRAGLGASLLSRQIGLESRLELDTDLLREIASASLPARVANTWVLHTGLDLPDAEEAVWLHGLGGGSGLELVGRFIGQSESLNQVICALVDNDSRYHAGAVCAEVMVSPRVSLDNVLPVTPPYARVISLDGKREQDDTREIPVRDLYVQASGEKVRMTLGQNGPEVIPRFSSALVHARNGSPIHRFLADLSSEFSLRSIDFWRQVGVSLDHKPRVVAGGVVVSPEMWTFPSKLRRELLGLKRRSTRWRRIEDELERMRVPAAFGLHEADNVLLLERGSPYTYAEIESRLTKGRAVQFSESPMLHARSNVLRGGRPVAHETVSFVLSDDHADYVRSARSAADPESMAYLDDWVYIRTTVRSGSDSVVIGAVASLATSLDAQWFFVRYGDPENHLRVRIRIPRKLGGRAQVAASLDELLYSGAITAWSQELYFPEVSRYGGRAGLILAHAVAHASSSYFVAVNPHTGSGENAAVIAAAVGGLVLLASLCADEAHARSIIDRQAQAFCAESGVSKVVDLSRALARELGATARNLQLGTPPEWLAEPLAQLRNRLVDVRESIVRRASDDEIAAMTHMHFNRSFDINSRSYELLCWVLLSRIKRAPGFKAFWQTHHTVHVCMQDAEVIA